jgi:hypothetical protein
MSKGRARVSVRNRWLRTIWNASPALMYSRAFSTAASNCARVKLLSIRGVGSRESGVGAIAYFRKT